MKPCERNEEITIRLIVKGTLSQYQLVTNNTIKYITVGYLPKYQTEWVQWTVTGLGLYVL